MPIIKKSFGKNYLQCYESEKGKTYSCEQIRKSWDNKVNYVTENSLKNTKEEAQKEFVDAFILRLLSEKKLWKIVLCLAVAAVCLSVRTETSPRKIVSAAVGYAWTDGTDRDLDALLQRADEKMYKNKQKMKRKRRTI